MTEATVCLKILYDETEYHHPKEWDWRSIVDLSHTQVVAIYVVEKREDVVPS